MKRSHKFVSLLIAAVLMAMAIVQWPSASVYAQSWLTQGYQPDTLYLAANGKSWSPSTGNLLGRIFTGSNGVRYSEAKADVVRWDPRALSWMTGNTGTPAITFHAFGVGRGCSAWQPSVLISTNLPSASITTKRAPNTCSGTQEIRVRAAKQSLQASPISYFATVQAVDLCTSNPCWPNNAKIPVDTYWISASGAGAENYHQHYCITSTSAMFSITTRSGC